MSMVRCDECEILIDSDLDPDCFNEFDETHCENCRQNKAEAGWERFCEKFYGGSDPLTIREKQVAAWRLK
jgi:hypothetical protein